MTPKATERPSHTPVATSSHRYAPGTDNHAVTCNLLPGYLKPDNLSPARSPHLLQVSPSAPNTYPTSAKRHNTYNAITPAPFPLLIPPDYLLGVPSPSPSTPSSPKISCCSTILYTLAFNSVNTVVVLRSSPRSASKISAEGFAARCARIPESYTDKTPRKHWRFKVRMR